MDVRLVYQPYAHNMAIFLDQQPIGMVSALSKYQTLPFVNWYPEIPSALAFEVNDSFHLTYVGRACEYRLLQKLLHNQDSCLTIRHENHQIGDSTLVRLKKLSRLVVNGVSCRKFSYPLAVYTDLTPDAAEELVRACLPKLAFCRLNLSIHALHELDGSQDKSTSIAMLSETATVHLRNAAAQTCGVAVAGNGIDSCINGAAVLFVSSNDMGACLNELLELIYWPVLLTTALEHVSVPKDSPFFPDVFVLDKTEPQCSVSLPKSIELGQSVPVQVSTIPKSNHIPSITCRVSNDTVISYADGCLTAVGTGEAIVEVYESGRITPLYSASVTAFRRNRIRKIQIQPLCLSMCVGETAKVRYSCTPTDADNFNALRLVSEDGTIAGIVSQEKVAARNPGTCCLFYEADKVQSDICEVTVYPRLEKLKISVEAETVSVNSLTAVTISRIPAAATLDRLTVTVEPPELGTYDMGSSQFFARMPGSGRLIVKGDRNNVTVSVPIHVLKSKTIPIKPILVAAGMAAVYILLKNLLGW